MVGGVVLEVDGFNEVIGTITLAKALHDAGRFDVIQQFDDALCYDTWFEYMAVVISSVFTSFYNGYCDGDETEIMIFMDNVISRYYTLAYEYGKAHKVPHNQNPYIIEAEHEVNRWLNFSYCIDWELLGYTNSRRAAKESKLIVRTCA